MLAVLDSQTYSQLLAEVQPTVIKTEEEYDRIVDRVEQLLFRENRSPEESALLDLLTLLVSSYDDQHYAIADCSGREVLLELMEDNGLKQADLVGVIGSKGIVSEVVNGKRDISKKQAQRLGEFFGLPYTIFL